MAPVLTLLLNLGQLKRRTKNDRALLRKATATLLVLVLGLASDIRLALVAGGPAARTAVPESDQGSL